MEYKKNDILTVTIEDIGNDGEGIGKVNGYTLFIKDAVIGDTVSCKIMKAKKNYAYARLEKIIKPSAIRTEPLCKYHRQCGGCQIQAMSYEAQLAFKQKKIRNNLVRIGGFEPEFIDGIMEPMVGMETPFYYRNKAQFPVGTDKGGKLITGFYAGRTHDIIANTDCVLGVKENKRILETVIAFMTDNHVSAYDEKTGRGLIRHILIRKGFASGEIMVCLVINYTSNAGNLKEKGGKGEGGGSKAKRKAEINAQTSMENKALKKSGGNGEYFPNQWTLVKVLSEIEGMASVSVSINTERTNVIMGKEVHTIWGKDTISDTIHVRNTSDFALTGKGITFHISPLSFYQVNPVQTEKLYSLALEYAGLTGKETVWDLYCGIGTISLFLAGKAKKVYGVEIVPQAIEDARENAKRNGIANVEFFVGRAEEILPEKYEREGIYADVIVVDPPRKGCDENCLAAMLRMKPERIVYVSCDSATLARDLKVLRDGGYEVMRVRGVDQFGQSVHVETVALLTRKAQ